MDDLDIPDFIKAGGKNCFKSKWAPGTLDIDGCLYFMPTYVKYLWKMVAFVGDERGEEFNDNESLSCMDSGTVTGKDGSIYGIPNEVTCVVKYDTVQDRIFHFEEEQVDYNCASNGAMGENGNVYAITLNDQILKSMQPTIPGIYKVILEVELAYFGAIQYRVMMAAYIFCFVKPIKTPKLKLKPSKKWVEGALQSDGIIYCIRYIDPSKM